MDETARAAKAAYMREYNRANHERVMAWRRANREARIETIRAQEREASRRYSERHPERRKAARAKYAQSDRGRAASVLTSARRRLRTADLDPIDISVAEVLRRRPCEYCGGHGGEIDHVVPVALGGTNDEANLVPACRSCNATKGASLVFMPA